MPGYTEKVESGELTSFKEYAMLCSRAMGVAIKQKEDSTDVPLIIEEVPNTSYMEESLAEAYKGLIEALAWTTEEAQAKSEEEFKETAAEEAIAENARTLKNSRYFSMREKVRNWHAPTPEHYKFKEFMIDQLNTSILLSSRSTVKAAENGEGYRVSQIKQYQRSIVYYSEQIEKEITRTQERNAWVRELIESLKNVD